MPLFPRMMPRLPVALRAVSVVMALGLIAGIAQMQTCRAEAKAPREPSSGEQSEGASGRTAFVDNPLGPDRRAASRSGHAVGPHHAESAV